MPNTKRNALAELAECLSNDAEYLYGNNDNASEDVSKAQRIVAELSKVRWWRSPSRWMPRGNNVSDILIKCRTIAEERGVCDVK